MAFEMIPVGTELYAKLSKKHDTPTRVMVMLPGLWRRSKIYGPEAETATSFAFNNFYDSNHMWYRMERAHNGKYLACVRVLEDGSSGSPVCINRELIVRTWAEEKQRRADKRAEELRIEKRDKEEADIFHQRLAAIAQVVLGLSPTAAAKLVAGTMARQSGQWREYGIDINHYGHKVEFGGQALTNLMHLIENAVGTPIESESLVDKVRRDRDEWQRRAESAEERLGAIKFMLEQK